MFRKTKTDGYKIVLTANRTLMSHYNGLIFLGFGACMTKGFIPDSIYYNVFCPSVNANKDGSAVKAPSGTRKIESTLLNNGFKEDDVIVAHPDHLDKVIGPNTKVLSITEFDPLGIGPATSTFTQLFGGEAYMNAKFKEILNHPLVQKYKPKIIIGGPGGWQLEDNQIRENLGVDCVIIGEGEGVVNDIVENACNDKEISPLTYGKPVPLDEIPLIKKPTIDGVIEIARGCGRGCKFCNPTLQRYRCLPLEHILKEVEVNLNDGIRPILHSEDVLRYKAKGFTVNKEAVIDLFRQVRGYPGVDEVGISHFALSSVYNAPEVIEEISNILEVDKNAWFSGQTGIETGSPRLIKNNMAGKVKPYKPEDWPHIVENAFQILSDNNWVPVSTLILGLPGETDNDVQLTIDLIENLAEYKSIIVPLFFVSQGGFKDKNSFNFHNTTKKECELFFKCWSHSLSWGKVLLKEYFDMSDENIIKTRLAERTFSYIADRSHKALDKCLNEYDYNLPRILQAAEEGEISILPRPLQTIISTIT